MNNSSLRMMKVIPTSRLAEYQNLGWSVGVNCMPTEEGNTTIRKEVTTAGGLNNHVEIQYRVPHYVQRGRIRRPLGQHVGLRLTQAVAMDYMGSAEFEFGVLPDSLRVTQSQFLLYKQHKFERLVATRDGKPFTMRVFANFDTEEQRDTYEGWLVDMQAGKLHMKESSGMEPL